jgi:hypothetical protein
MEPQLLELASVPFGDARRTPETIGEMLRTQPTPFGALVQEVIFFPRELQLRGEHARGADNTAGVKRHQGRSHSWPHRAFRGSRAVDGTQGPCAGHRSVRASFPPRRAPSQHLGHEGHNDPHTTSLICRVMHLVIAKIET